MEKDWWDESYVGHSKDAELVAHLLVDVSLAGDSFVGELDLAPTAPHELSNAGRALPVGNGQPDALCQGRVTMRTHVKLPRSNK